MENKKIGHIGGDAILTTTEIALQRLSANPEIALVNMELKDDEMVMRNPFPPPSIEHYILTYNERPKEYFQEKPNFITGKKLPRKKKR